MHSLLEEKYKVNHYILGIQQYYILVYRICIILFKSNISSS